MKAITGYKKYKAINSKRGVKNMCDVLQGAIAEGRTEGELIGTVKTLYSYMKKTPKEIADIVNRSVEYIEEILEISHKKFNYNIF